MSPPWEFLLSVSRSSLQSFELSRLSHASNLRKEIVALLDEWVEENAAGMLARWLLEQPEPSSPRGHRENRRASASTPTAHTPGITPIYLLIYLPVTAVRLPWRVLFRGAVLSDTPAN